MKSCAILIAALVLCVQSATINNPEDELVKTSTCLSNSGVSFDSLRNINSGRFANDPKLKEYLLCVSKIAGFQNEAGNFQNDIIRVRLKGGHYSDDAIEEVVQECTRRKETPQETAFQFMKCVYGNTFQKKYT